MVKLFTTEGMIDTRIINDHIANQENIVIIDDSKKYINEYYNSLKSKGYNVHILNFDDTKKSHGFNFLEYPYSLYKNNDVDKLSDSLKAITETFSYKSEDPYWQETSSSFIEGIIRLLFEDAKQSEINIKSMWHIIEKGDYITNDKDPIKDYFKTKKKTEKSYICISPFINVHNDTRFSILSLVKNSFKDLMTRDNLLNVVSGNDISIKDFKKKKQAVFINIPKATLLYNKFVPIFINQLFLFLISDSYPKCNIIINNLSDFKEFYNIDEMAKVRSNNINFEIGTDYITFRKTFNEDTCVFYQTYDSKQTKQFNKYPKTKQVDFKIYDFLSHIKPEKGKLKNIDLDKLINDIDKEIERIDKEADNNKK